MVRRTFLVSCLSSSLAAPLAALPPERIKIGFLGGRHLHASAKVKLMRESPQYELVGIWEEDPAVRSQYEKTGVPIVKQDDLLGDRSVQVIAVESNIEQLPRYGRLALEAGKHIHIDKPPSDNMEDFRSMVAIARQKQLLMQTGYMWRYHPGINAALEAARNGWLGDVYLVRGTMNSLIAPDRRPLWGLFRGGQMFQDGCHLIDPLIRLLGAPLKVTPFLKKHGPFDDNVADNTMAIFEYSHAFGVIVSSALQPDSDAHRTFEVLGTNGTAVVRPIEPASLDVDLLKPAGPYQGGSQSVTLAPYVRYVGEFEELAEAVRLRRPLSISPNQDLLVHEAV